MNCLEKNQSPARGAVLFQATHHPEIYLLEAMST